MSVDGIATPAFLDDVTGAYTLEILGGHNLVTPFTWGSTWSEVSRTNVSGVWTDVGGYYGMSIELIDLSVGGQLITRFTEGNVLLQIDVALNE